MAFLVLAVLALSAAQVSLASEDYDWSDPSTALWAIARENGYINDQYAEAAKAVEDAAQLAKQNADAVVAKQLADWQAPVQAAAEKAKAAGADLSSGVCQDSYDLSLKIFSGQLKASVPVCVVAGRAQWDARLNKLQAVAASELDLIVKVQGEIETCAARPGALLQALCRQTKVQWTVLSAQDLKSKKALPHYLDTTEGAADNISAVVADCVSASVKRSTFDAETARDNAVSCFGNLKPQQQ